MQGQQTGLGPSPAPSRTQHRESLGEGASASPAQEEKPWAAGLGPCQRRVPAGDQVNVSVCADSSSALTPVTKLII